MATVITNLMSAIPWVGQDIVESNNIIDIYTRLIYLSMLPIVGNIHINALNKLNNTKIISEKEYISIPKSFLGFLVGFIDGDGYIQISKTSKGFITIKLVISLHLNDLSTLEYIHSVIKIGNITTYRDNRSPTCKLIINRTDLQKVIFPLLLYHNIFFLSHTRRAQFDLAMYILKNDVKIFHALQEIDGKSNISSFFFHAEQENATDYLNLHFFRNWIVGFTMAEGSFFVKNNKDGCFQLKQRLHLNLFEAFKLAFNTNRKIYTEKGLYNQFGISSKLDVQEVINFFSFSGLHPLIGLKGIQYMKWLENLSSSTRYRNLHFPSDIN